MAGVVESLLAELGIAMPAAPRRRRTTFRSCRRQPALVSGQISRLADGRGGRRQARRRSRHPVGQRAAELCALNILAQVKAAVGDLDRVVRVVRLNGFVNSAPEFTDHPQVINGASNLIGKILGERGKHSRCASGSPGCPSASPSIDAVIEVA